jgi:hypothetical protein
MPEENNFESEKENESSDDKLFNLFEIFLDKIKKDNDKEHISDFEIILPEVPKLKRNEIPTSNFNSFKEKEIKIPEIKNFEIPIIKTLLSTNFNAHIDESLKIMAKINLLSKLPGNPDFFSKN